MKNNKGVTITEIVISVTLVSIILVFLLNLLITIRGYSEENKNKSDALINRAIITREVENDFKDYDLKGISTCDASVINDTNVGRLIPSGTVTSSIYCLKLIYDNTLITDNIGYLVQYNYNNKNVVGYKRGSNQTIRETGLEMNPGANPGTVVSSCVGANENCSLVITIPIIDNNLNDYSITLTYIYPKAGFTYTTGERYGFKIS